MNKHIEEAAEEIIQGYFGHPEHWGPHDPQRAMELKKIARQALTSIYQRGREEGYREGRYAGSQEEKPAFGGINKPKAL